MTPRMLLVIAAVAIGVAVGALIVGAGTMFGTALATAMGFGIAADLMREDGTTWAAQADPDHEKG
ncbi:MULTISPECIES: hypothetical protein [Mycolicibacterium]|uniref:Uncharacterized protein n=2 Tax=Mycolicibacterium TaxID=1866885 RepID=A0AAE5AD76_MYCFO|nr:hypothetical protein [Mycolicibacterium fortuitum]MDV7192563.1 hypothetical protein [Mycolicibacterium fortuitum]MDV7205464.1 hypothetical protein [Mycolicibacterium fortuitum]MDV7227045.1 hypothetical protein [Mycolicibacterium fortuitum]MDV7259710.1 hypothetical protein [Mycolicibacterium fortuitum]MDV7286273.1 hypothetical protein [Mycolicibacterium fortuitum]